MKLAVAGLGRMGLQIARKLAENGHEVVAHNRSHAPIEQAAGYGALAAPNKADVIAAFPDEPVRLWLMLPADVIDGELEAWLKLLPPNSLIIDGGNSDFRHTGRRGKLLTDAGHRFVDVGTSGGIWGYDNGFSLMIGGHQAGADSLKPIFETLSKPSGAYHYFGSHGTGHYVKMVHNAIEYGMMQSLAEGYRMLKEGPMPDLDLAAAGEVWQHGSVITSWLNDLSQQALAENPELTGVDGFVAESGEARWTLEAAHDMNIPLPAIEAAFAVRLASQQGQTNFSTKLLAAMRHKFGGHQVNQVNKS